MHALSVSFLLVVLLSVSEAGRFSEGLLKEGEESFVFGLDVVKAISGRSLKQSDPRSTCPREVCEAVERKDPNTLKRLIDAGQTTCFCTCNTRLLVRASVLSECTECIEHLITSPSNCNINGRLFGGNSALHEAAAICQIAVGDVRRC